MAGNPILVKYGIMPSMEPTVIREIIEKRNELIKQVVDSRGESTNEEFRKTLAAWKDTDASEQVQEFFDYLRDLVFDLGSNDPAQLAVLHENLSQTLGFVRENRDDCINEDLDGRGLTTVPKVDTNPIRDDIKSLGEAANNTFEMLLNWGVDVSEFKSKEVTVAGRGKVPRLHEDVLVTAPKGPRQDKAKGTKGHKSFRATYYLNDNPTPMRIGKVCELINKARPGVEKITGPKVFDMVRKNDMPQTDDWELFVDEDHTIRQVVQAAD